VDSIHVVKADDCAPDPEQPRRYFNKKRLQELAESILEFGQREPIKVVNREALPGYVEGSPRWMINDGERRWRAIKMLELPSIRMKVISAGTSNQRFIQSVTANLGREDHTPMEYARAVDKIIQMDEFNTLNATERDRQVAALFARSTQWVYIQRRLMQLSPDIHALIEHTEDDKPRLNAQVALALMGIDSEAERSRVAKEIVDKNLGKPQASALIRSAIANHGLTPGHRGLRPSDGAVRVGRYVKKIHTHAENILGFKAPELRAYLAGRPAEREMLIFNLDEALGSLAEVKQALENIKPV
jgi:ParB/RepB/Spo0J family partition protein